MRRSTAFMASAACLLMACEGGQAPVELGMQDIDAIRAVQDAYVQAALAGDWDKWGETLAADVVLMPPNQEPLEGRAAAVAWGRQFPKLSSFIAPPGEMSGCVDVAYSVGEFAYEATPAEGPPVAEQGRFINILRKDPDGAWRYSRAIWNSPGSAKPDQARDESAIRATISTAETALNARDFAAYAQTFTEDGDLQVYPGSRSSGRAAIQGAMVTGWKSQPPACRVAVSADSVRFLSADLVLVDAPATFKGCKGWSTNDAASVMRRVGDGWQIASLRIAPRSG